MVLCNLRLIINKLLDIFVETEDIGDFGEGVIVEERKPKEETLPDLEAIKIQAELREAPPVPDEEPEGVALTPVPGVEEKAPAPEYGEELEEKQAEGNSRTTCRPALLAIAT